MAGEAGGLRALVVGAARQTRQGDDRSVRGSLAAVELAEELEAVHARHPQVAQHEIARAGGHGLQCFDAVPGGKDMGAEPLEQETDRFERVVGVLDHEDAHSVQIGNWGHHHGPPERLGFRDQVKPHGNIGATTGPVAGNADGPIVRIDQPFDERQTDPEPTVAPACPPLLLRNMSNTKGRNSAAMPSPVSRTWTTASSPSRVNVNRDAGRRPA